MTNELDELGVDLCTSGLVPWLALGRRERTEVVRRLTELRLSLAEIAARLETSPRTVSYHRRKFRTPPPPPPCPEPAAAPDPHPERTPAVPHTIEEIRETAENLITDMQSAQDLTVVRANCLTIAGSDPLLAAQVMMALASWIPLTATPKWLRRNEEQLIAERSAFHLGLAG